MYFKAATDEYFYYLLKVQYVRVLDENMKKKNCFDIMAFYVMLFTEGSMLTSYPLGLSKWCKHQHSLADHQLHGWLS